MIAIDNRYYCKGFSMEAHLKPGEGGSPIRMRVLDVEDGALVVSPALDLVSTMQLRAGSDLYLEVQPDRVFLSRLDPRLLRQLAFAREGMARYRNTLRELAK